MFQENKSINLNTTCVYIIISNLSPEDGINQKKTNAMKHRLDVKFLNIADKVVSVILTLNNAG